MPGCWHDESAPWLTLKLREDIEAILRSEGQISVMLEMERQQSARVIQRGRLFHALVTCVAAVLIIGILAGAFYLFWRHRALSR